MGITYIRGDVRAAGGRGRARRVRFLVDSGAVYSLLPQKEWRALRLRPTRTLEFELADGTTIERKVGEAVFELMGERGTSPVILGEPGDEALLGAVTLEVLGLMLDPFQRRLLPMRLMLAMRRARR